MRSRSSSPRQFRSAVLVTINKVLEDSKVDGVLDEETISDLVCKAQIESNALSEEVDRCKKEIMENMAESESELGSITLMAKNLSSRLLTVQSQLEVADDRTEGSVGFLRRVDRLKSRIEHCYKITSEMQKWKYRLKSVEVLFGLREFGRIASEIQEMENSLQLLKNVPNNDGRISELNELRNKLETLCSPHLLVAIQKDDLAAIQSYYVIFNKIGRRQTITQTYLSSRTDWMIQLDAKFQTDNRCGQVQDWLPEYLSEIATMLRSELQTLPTRLPDVNASELVLHVAKVIKRKLSFWMEQHTIENDDAVEGIVSACKISKKFLQDISIVVESSDDLVEISSLFVSVFVPFSTRYLELESKKLSSISSQLRDMLEISEDCRKSLNSIESSLDHLLTACRNALSRCQDFGQGLNIKAFQFSVDSFVSDYTERLLISLRHIRKITGFDSNEPDNIEWASTSTAFRLVRFARRLILQLEAFDSECISSLSRLLSVLISDDNAVDISLRFSRQLMPQNRSTVDYLQNIVDGRLFSDTSMLSQSKVSAQKLEKSMKTFTFDIMLKESRELLREFSSWPCWTETTHDLSLVSSQPSHYITRLGDQLFGFVPELESQLNLDKMLVQSADDMLQWLRQLSFAAIEDLLTNIMSLPALSDLGSKQLATDLEYLVNILSALGIEAPSSLTTMQKSLTLSPLEVTSLQIDGRSDQIRVDQVASIRRMTSSDKNKF